MKVLLDGKVFEGTAPEIIDRFRRESFDPADFPDCESFLKYMRDNFVRMTNLPCELQKGSIDESARAMLEQLSDIGALEIVDGG